MPTSAVNPMQLLAPPSAGAARSQAVSDGFADTLDKAIRREDAPVARRDRSQPTDTDQPYTKPKETDTKLTDNNVDQQPSKRDTEASSNNSATEPSQEGKPEEKPETAELN